MGAYFLFVNPAKRQYLDPSRFGEGIKAGSLLHGQHGFALSLLLCDTSEARLGYGALAGAWCGDAVYAASDEAPPDLHGLATATPDDPQRNLNSLARDEYEDVSYPALAMLGENEWTAGSLVGGVARALRDPGTAERRPPLLGHLGNTVLQTGCKPLAAELTQQLGGVAAWQRLYAEACEAHRLLPTPSYGAPDPWNALWVLPPAVRPGVVARGRRTARGPAWAADDAALILEHADHHGFIPIGIEAWEVLTGDPWADYDGRAGGAPPVLPVPRVLTRWVPDPPAPGDERDEYTVRALARAAAALNELRTRVVPERSGALRFAVQLHGGEPSWRTHLPKAD